MVDNCPRLIYGLMVNSQVITYNCHTDESLQIKGYWVRMQWFYTAVMKQLFIRTWHTPHVMYKYATFSYQFFCLIGQSFLDLFRTFCNRCDRTYLINFDVGSGGQPSVFFCLTARIVSALEIHQSGWTQALGNSVGVWSRSSVVHWYFLVILYLSRYLW